MSDSSRLNEHEIASLAASVKAPESLHRRVQAMAGEAAARGEKRGARLSAGRLRLGVAAVAAAGIAAAALAVSLPGGGSSGLTVQTAAALALKQATMPAPAENRAVRSQLELSVEGVAFPYWSERFGWRSTGERTDNIGGRSVTTVFYSGPRGHRIGYAIAAGRAPRLGGSLRWHAGVPYRVFSQNGATAVAWPRNGHLCVMAGRGVSPKMLLRLAGWSQPGANA